MTALKETDSKPRHGRIFVRITMGDVPPYLVGSLTRKRGKENADLWLNNALVLAEELTGRWGFIPMGTLSGGTKSLCITGHVQRGARAVLKISPIQQMGRHEVESLLAWDGRGVPQVLAVDWDTSSFLMEHLEHVSDLPSPSDVLALSRVLHSVDPGNREFPTLEHNIGGRIELAQRRLNSSSPEERVDDLEEVVSLVGDLLSNSSDSRLLHGDFQSKNMINTSSTLHAIDPMPCMGDPLFDLALWLVGSTHSIPTDELAAGFRDDMDTDEYSRFLLWARCLSVLEDDHTGLPISEEKRRSISSLIGLSRRVPTLGQYS